MIDSMPLSELAREITAGSVRLAAATAARLSPSSTSAAPVRASASGPARTGYPDGEPPLPEAMQVNGERIDLAYVVGVLMGNRDLSRRLAAESGAQLTG
jgi:hypothetical protein